MRHEHGPTFRPALESLEGRCLLTSFRGSRVLTPGQPLAVAFQSSRQAAAPQTAAPVALTTAAPATPRTVSVVPSHISLGLFDTPAGVTPRTSESGLRTRGLPFVSTRQTDAGLGPSGMRFFTPSQLPRRETTQAGGFRLGFQGEVYGQTPW